jgi:DNA-binding response OmpR family regulator
MAQVILVSDHCDFTDPVCELAKRELNVECVVINDEKKAHSIAQAVVITDKNPPFRMRDLLGAIKTAMQVSQNEEPLKIGRDYQFYRRQKKLVDQPSQKSVDLTDKEAELLQCMIKTREASREMLLKEVWSMSADLNTHTLETHIYRLRAKFKELSGEDVIEASDGGYRLVL